MTYAERSGAARGDGRHLLRGHLRKRMPLGQLRTTTPRWEADRRVGGSAGRRVGGSAHLYLRLGVVGLRIRGAP